MEPKAKTLQERFGFADPDLKTPKHDAIMLWLDAEMPTVLAQLFGAPAWEYKSCLDNSYYRDYRSEIPTDGFEGELEAMRARINADLGIASVPHRKIVKTWERPIVDRAHSKAYTIGFADMLVTWADQVVACNFRRLGYKTWEYVSSEVNYGHTRGAYFEVKPSIPSLGELIRQLRMYQTYTQDAPWVVVSPDTRFADQLRAQGFNFVAVLQAVSA